MLGSGAGGQHRALAAGLRPAGPLPPGTLLQQPGLPWLTEALQGENTHETP